LDNQTDNKKSKSEQILGQVEEGYVSLPFNKGEFREFIRGLLGNPQSITKSIEGVFEINFDELRNIHTLIIQRITQQNDGALVKFLAKIVFSDDSSVEFNTINELLTYNEIRNVTSTVVHLSWDFIVTFQDKKIPEKQRIQVSYISSGKNLSDYDKDFTVLGHRYFFERGFINFRIEHTARSWGADIESLLTNHINSLIRKQSKFKEFIRHNSGKIAFSLGTLFFLCSLVYGFISANIFSSNRLNEVENKLKSFNNNSLIDVNNKVDYLINFNAGGAWSRYYFALVVFVIFSFIISIIIAIWAEGSASNQEPSFILLTKESWKHKEREFKKLNKKWISFFAAIITAIITGIASNYLFAVLFNK
jgi:hypothetical protein